MSLVKQLNGLTQQTRKVTSNLISVCQFLLDLREMAHHCVSPRIGVYGQPMLTKKVVCKVIADL